MQKAITIFFNSAGVTNSMNPDLNEMPWILVYVDPFSLRIRIDDYSGPAHEVSRLIWLFKPDWTEKVILKSRSAHIREFERLGFTAEAKVYRYFSGEDMYFLAAYPLKSRASSNQCKVFRKAVTNGNTTGRTGKSLSDAVKIAGTENADELACLFQQVFPLYPTPINNASYIRELMQSDIVFMYIRSNGKIVSAASAEINIRHSNAELTDCASLPEAAGKGNMTNILVSLTDYLRKRNISGIYSIARAESIPMNRIFERLDFNYTGCLVNNVKISTGIENMFVWSIP